MSKNTAWIEIDDRNDAHTVFENRNQHRQILMTENYRYIFKKKKKKKQIKTKHNKNKHGQILMTEKCTDAFRKQKT